MASAVTLKKNYRCFQSLQQFFSGGPFSVSSDGSFIVCACDNTVKIVGSSNAAIKSTIEGDSEPVTALLLSPDDRLLFTAGHSRQIRVWDISSLKCLRSWKGHEGPIMGMACHASGGLLATAGSDRKVQVWDVDGGFCTHNFKGHKGVVTCIIFHPLRQLIFSGGDDSTVRVWDLTSKKCVKTLEKHQSTVTSIAISEDGWTLVTASRDKLVNLWDLHDYCCSTTVPVYEAVESVCTFGSASSFALALASFTDENKKKKNKKSLSVPFVTVGERGIVRIWNSDGTILFEQHSSNLTDSVDKEDVKRGFTSVTMMPLGQGLLCATADQQFLIYNLEKCAADRLDLVLKKRLIGYNEEIVDMKFLGEEEQFLAVATSVEQVRVYDLASMSCSYVLTGHTDVVLCLDTCLEGSGKSLIVTGSKDNTVRLWDSQRQCCMGVGIGHMGAVGALAFSKKSRDFFVSGSSDRTLKVWSLDVISDSAGDVYNLKSKAVVAAHDKDINSVAIAPNDSLVCSGSQDRTAAIWRLPDLVSVVVLRGHKRGIWSVEFSPVDQCVITASGDKTIKIWAISEGSCLKTFEGHLSSVTRASFITRGTQFVSCGADGLLKLWTVKTDECLATYDQHEDKIWTLAIGKQTELLVTGGGDAVINLWRDSTSEEMEEAFRKEEEDVLRGQELDNAVSDSDYSRAIQLAFELRRPHKLLEIFTEICWKSEADVHIDQTLLRLGNEQLRVLMEYIRDWNTKPKSCYTAQRVLQCVYLTIPPEDFDKISGISELLNVINAYTKRHYDRLRRYGISCHLPGIILARKSVVQPEKDETEPRNVALKRIQIKAHNPTEVAEEEKSMDKLEPKDESVKKKRKLPASKQTKEKKKKDA